MAIVCIWDAKSKRAAHASIIIVDGCDWYDTEFYASWFPEKGYKGKKALSVFGPLTGVGAKSAPNDYAHDRQMYSTCKAYKIKDDLKLNGFGMINYWLANKHKLKWKMMRRNCAQMVVNILRAGGANISKKAWWTPNETEKWLLADNANLIATPGGALRRVRD